MGTLEEIKAETEERKLLAQAYYCHGAVKAGLMLPAIYADCMVELAKKLGFPPLEDNLAEVADKYLSAS